jgi:transposase-like protein
VGGKWKYLFRAADKHDQLIDFMLSDRRNSRAAYRFLRQALKTMSECPPLAITTDKLASYPRAISRLKQEGYLAHHIQHWASKHLNNIIEADHGALKRMIRRRHCVLTQPGVAGEIRLVNQLFGLAA